MSKAWAIDATADLRKYVHEDPKTFNDKLALMRSLHVPKDAPQMAKETLKDLFLHIADSLVLYAKGKHTTMKPYGMQVSRSTRAFKELPSTLLALTYAVMYQACRNRPSRLQKWKKTPRPHITAPWSRGMISRFVKLQTTFANSRADMFAVYEKYDGDYMGEESSGSNDQTKRDLAAEEANEDF